MWVCHRSPPLGHTLSVLFHLKFKCIKSSSVSIFMLKYSLILSCACCRSSSFTRKQYSWFVIRYNSGSDQTVDTASSVLWWWNRSSHQTELPHALSELAALKLKQQCFQLRCSLNIVDSKQRSYQRTCLSPFSCSLHLLQRAPHLPKPLLSRITKGLGSVVTFLVRTPPQSQCIAHCIWRYNFNCEGWLKKLYSWTGSSQAAAAEMSLLPKNKNTCGRIKTGVSFSC